MTSESVDVLAAQVRAGIHQREGSWRTAETAEALKALDVLVGYAKRAEELERALARIDGQLSLARREDQTLTDTHAEIESIVREVLDG